MNRLYVVLAAAGLMALAACPKRGDVMTQESGKMNEEVTAEAKKLADRLDTQAWAAEKKANVAQWEAWTTGTEQAYAAMEKEYLAYKQVFSSIEDRTAAKGFLTGPALAADPILKRRVEVLYNVLAAYSIPPEDLKTLTEMETAVDRAFSTYRAKVGDRELTTNDIYEILRSSKDRELRKAAWEGQKAVGPLVAPDLLKLMKLRNKVARDMGFPDFWQMQLALSEIDPVELMALMDRYATSSDELFRKTKALIDEKVSAFLGIEPGEVMPWDMSDPYFQEVPESLMPDFSGQLGSVDPVEAARLFYEGIGLDVSAVLSRSSLYEAPGKNPHAFSMDMDREGDVRILCNVKNTLQWHSTMLHELGHALYSTFLDKTLPWSLRQEAHPLTTEGVAMFFEAVASTGSYLSKLAGVPADKAAAMEADLASARVVSRLVFIRWCQVMVRFEKEAYANPDQDLEALWWGLAERYQYLRRPEGRKAADWATKIHIALVPVYYQNYLLGETFAAQVRHFLANKPGAPACFKDRSLLGCKEVSDYFQQEIFRPGKLLPWPELIEKATGEKLTSDHLLAELGAP